MAPKPLPDQATLLQLLRYEPETGKLFWRERTPDMFKDGRHSAEHICRRWNTRYADGEAFTAVSDNRLVGRLLGSNYLAHRVIWKMMMGHDPGEDIDHGDGDGLNNRFYNLSSVAHAINQKNLKLSSNNKTGVSGVLWRDGKWCARIGVNGASLYLGRFENFDDAVFARKAAERFHGFSRRHGTC